MLKKPWLWLPSKLLYALNPLALKIYSQIRPAQTYRWNSFEWRGLKFLNPLGTAGGVDKNAQYIREYQALGAGFLELGTVTPLAQGANEGKILDKSLRYQSLWNNMGCPNKGLDFFKIQLEKAFELAGDSLEAGESAEAGDLAGAGDLLEAGAGKLPPLFINLGKNRESSIRTALLDYQTSMKALEKYAGAFVINISSPNTKSLRNLFDRQKLPDFLKALNQTRSGLSKNTPLILKISPDEEDFIRIIEQSLEAGIDGWCVCNSSKQRPVKNLFPSDKGGLSGQLLADTSLSLLKQLRDFLKKNQIEDKLVISCGGVLSPQELFERLRLGADLVQVYSALVFKGYGFFHSVYKQSLIK